uniref:Uncharacterized protein n=1 Tax=Rhizophora mucronata TaxID=61149 RepID=A0A2P2IK33_RHIMU
MPQDQDQQTIIKDPSTEVNKMKPILYSAIRKQSPNTQAQCPYSKRQN